MQFQSLRASALLTLSLGSLGSLIAQNEPGSHGTVLPGATPAKPNANAGLPTFLLEVPGGEVVLGLDDETFLRAIAEASFPLQPQKAHLQAAEKFKFKLQRSSGSLGRKKVPVDSFLLGKHPVTNAEYASFVEAERAAGRGIKPPFLWWQVGCKEDFEAKLDDIRAAFPGDARGAVNFWERHGETLPFKVQDKDGKSVGDLPVVYVSWRDANRFAASLGMRLPTETELTRAMRGDSEATWPLGQPGNDHFTEDLLKQLRIHESSDKVLKPVGTVPAAAGPYGHVDMFGQVFQLCADVGYEPLNGKDVWDEAWKRLQKDKIGRIAERGAVWNPSKAIAKGGSFLSGIEPEQLLIDARIPMETTDVVEGVGFRLAKSLRPGYDYLLSMQRIGFTKSVFQTNQDLDLTAQLGAERYTMNDAGFPRQYDAVSFAPVNFLSTDKRARLDQMLEESMTTPLLIGGLGATANFSCGAGSGLYAVFYRKSGIPRELQEAIKRAHKQILKERKDAEKEAKDDKADKAKDDDKKQDPKNELWRTIVKTYGLTEDDLADEKAATGNLGFVRYDELKVSTEHDMFLLSKDGKMVAALAATNHKPVMAPGAVSKFEVVAGEKEAKGKTVAKLEFTVPLLEGKSTKLVQFEMHVVLDQAPPSAETPWRLPAVGK